MAMKAEGFLPDSDSEDELPPGWEEQATEHGLVCYANLQNNSKQWTHPRTGCIKRIESELPIDWEASTEANNQRIIFTNKRTNQCTYVDPRLAFAKEVSTQNAARVRQRFDASSTAMQILHGKNLSGRTALITGANCGIGLETARSLLLHGCEVIFACRNRVETTKAIDCIANEHSAARKLCHFMELDLSALSSVSKFVTEVKATYQNIDLLILNAGVFALPYTLTRDGLETTFQVSHLSHFYLTLQLEALLKPNSRVIVLSSESHRMANLPAHGLSETHLSPPAKSYWSMMAYNNAKLCNVLFAQELANRWKQRGIFVFSLHPGNMVSTKLSRNWWFYRLLFAFVRPFTKSLQQAAATSIYCATADELTGLTGFYFNNCYFCEPSKLSKVEQLRQDLWKLSEQMVERILEQQKHDNNL